MPSLPVDYHTRPVAVLGAGVLGRRIACIWASAGYTVHLRDPSEQQRGNAQTYVNGNVESYAAKTGKKPGKATAFESLENAVKNAWLVIEAVPEKLQLKIDTFAALESAAPADCILASNSSSYKTSEMIDEVQHNSTKERIINCHYYMPPICMVVELMTSGYTRPEIFPFMVQRGKEAATFPFVARKESTGFIYNRVWAAIKREILTLLAEGVSEPAEIDEIWGLLWGTKLGPCGLMDSVGLDTVAFIEDHYVKERGLSREKTVDYLTDNFISQGKLGEKSTKGGLYPPKPQKIIALNIGLVTTSNPLTSGEILELSPDGQILSKLVTNQRLPDGIVIEKESQRMIWTNMGTVGNPDGTVLSANLDGTDIKTLIGHGTINTPKQIALHREAKQIYFCDREGFSVYRCNLDGSRLERVIHNNDETQPNGLRWCIGVAVSPKYGKFYWTQKGFPKSNQGRIFCADIGTKEEIASSARCILQGLPEPIDLEVDETNGALYCTDRGEIPRGNTLNRVQLDENGLPIEGTLKAVVNHLSEAIGVHLHVEGGHVYFGDLSGSIYRSKLDGSKKTRILLDDNRAFAGLAIL